jgi:TonB family protein
MGGGNGSCLAPPCGGGSPIATGFYTRYLSNALQERVADNDKINRQIFSADFSVTINASGQVTAVQLLRSSGNGKRDQLLLAALQSIRGLDAPPATFRFPQKITVRGSRGF